MATKFPRFSQGLAQDPTTRRIWYGIATAHDLKVMMVLQKKRYIKRSLLPILAN